MRSTGKILVVMVLFFILTGLPGMIVRAEETEDVIINETTFPDDNFRNYIIGSFDKDGDKVIKGSEISQITTIQCGSKQIKDLKGIEYVPKEHQEKVLKNIKLYVKDPHGKIVKELFLIDLKGKFAIKTEEAGLYYICAKYFKTWKLTQLPKEVLLGIKIRTDYVYNRIDKVLKKEELSDLMEEIRQVAIKVIPSISSSKMEIDEEDKMAKAIISTSNLYFNLALLQLLLIFIIAIYQIFNLRKFLSSKRII